jgi:arylsulfatase A-like enzyme
MSDQPNIVMLLLDTARARNLSCYGNTRKTTPFIDSLADEGVVYERAFSQSIWSLPSYASLFTGKYPSEHGAIDWGRQIDRNTLVQGLKESGYETLAVSNHLLSGKYGIAQIFDQVELAFGEEGRPYPDDPLIQEMDEGTAQERWDSTKEKYIYFLREAIKRRSWKGLANGFHDLYEKFREQRGWWSDQGAARSIEIAKKITSDAEQPFFFFINFVEPHFKYKPPKGYIRQFMPEDVSFDEIQEAVGKQLLNVSVGHGEITERQEMILERLHEAELYYVDQKLEEFYEHLEAEGKADNTIFIVLSDHGDMFGKDGIWGHRGRIYNQVCHVPLIVRYPWSDCKRDDGITEIRQLHDHLIAIAGGSNERLKPQGEAFVEYYGLDTQQSFKPWDKFDDVKKEDWVCYQAGYVTDRYKLLWDSNDQVQLFDIVNDFDEHDNIAETEKEQTEEMKYRIQRVLGEPSVLHRQYRQKERIREDTDDITI